MSDTRLICFEGMPGSGKSTTSQRLWLHLLRNGRNARWVYEHDTNHPIWNFDEQREIVESGILPPAFLDDVLLGRWQSLADGLAGLGPTTILESALLQTPIGFLLALDVAERTILEHVLKVGKTIACLSPTLIYMRNGDVAKALRDVCDDRRSDLFESALVERLAGTPYGRSHAVRDFVGLTGFYERFVEIADELFDRFKLAKLVVDPAVGWPECERKITEFLWSPRIQEPPNEVEGPARYLGRYKDARLIDEMEVAADASGLYLAGTRRTRLIYKDETQFYVQSIGAEVWFERETGGRFAMIRLVGNLPNLSPEWFRI